MSWDWLNPVSLVGDAIGVVANSIGSSEAKKAADAAAQQRAQGFQNEQAKLGQIEEANAPGQTYLRGVVAGSADLTPEQAKQLDDLRRSTTNQIRGSSIAGSGRSAAAIIRDGEQRFTLGALGQNRARADSAASAMAGRGFQAGTGIAKANEGIGNAYGTAAEEKGMISYNNAVNNGKLIGGSFGDISSNINRTENPFRRFTAAGGGSDGGGSSGGGYGGGGGGGGGATYYSSSNGSDWG